MEATMLVAFIKYAGKGRDFIFDRDKTDKEFYDKKCDKIMTACYLMNCFCIKVCRFPRTYHLNITENGPIYGKCFEVQLGPFLQLLTDVVAKIIEDIPKVYQDKINAYMNAPFSDENIAVSKKIKQTLYPKYKSVKKYADKWRKGVIDADCFYILCDKIYFQEQITNILALLHCYDSMTDIEGIKRNKYLFMAFHLYLTNIINSPLVEDYGKNDILDIMENGMKKHTTLLIAMQKIQPAIQRRVDALPSDIRGNFLKVYLDNNDDNMGVYIEHHLLKDIREWCNQIDFDLLKCRQFGNNLL